MPSKVIVTGGCGFIGSNFIKKILSSEKNVEIVNIDSLTYAGNLENLLDISDNQNYTFWKIDLCDFESLEKIISEFHFHKEIFIL